MSGSEERPDERRVQTVNGSGLLASLVLLGLGARIAAVTGSASWGRCLRDGSCGGIFEVALEHPMTALTSVAIVNVSALPLLLWVRRARRDPTRLGEVSGAARSVVGYFSSAMAVVVGMVLQIETAAWWTLPTTISLWFGGFAIVTMPFHRSRTARAIHLAALMLFPVLMRGLLAAAA